MENLTTHLIPTERNELHDCLAFITDGYLDYSQLLIDSSTMVSFLGLQCLCSFYIFQVFCSRCLHLQDVTMPNLMSINAAPRKNALWYTLETLTDLYSCLVLSSHPQNNLKILTDFAPENIMKQTAFPVLLSDVMQPENPTVGYIAFVCLVSE